MAMPGSSTISSGEDGDCDGAAAGSIAGGDDDAMIFLELKVGCWRV